MKILFVCLVFFFTSPSNETYGQASPEKFVRGLYAAISFKPGSNIDWNSVEDMFLEEAVITLRASKEKVNVFTVGQWVQDFKDFIVGRELENIGFNESVVGIKSFEFGDMAHVLVLYEPRIPGIDSDRQGVDSIHLIRQEGRWKIVSILNELPTTERPVPETLKN